MSASPAAPGTRLSLLILGEHQSATVLDGPAFDADNERAGVTQPALYRHVDGAADLWRSLGLATRSELANELAEIDPPRSGGRREVEAAVERVLDILTRALRGFEMSDDDVLHNALMLRCALHGFVSFELGDGNPGHLRASETFTRLVDMLCTSFESTPRDLADLTSPT